jgi:hypothetical protein
VAGLRSLVVVVERASVLILSASCAGLSVEKRAVTYLVGTAQASRRLVVIVERVSGVVMEELEGR